MEPTNYNPTPRQLLAALAVALRMGQLAVDEVIEEVLGSDVSQVRRTTEEEQAAWLRAAMAVDRLTVEEIQKTVGHNSIETLLVYRRKVRRKPLRTMRATPELQGRRSDMTLKQVAEEVLGHRSNTTELYLRRHDPFRRADQDADEQ